MAAIPDSGGAQCASCGVTRALFRVAVLGGLIVAAWLLGSGIGHADENPGQPSFGLTRVVGAAPSDGATPADGGDGVLGVPATVGSAVTRVLTAAPAPRRAIQPPANFGVLSPAVKAVGVPRLLTPVVAPVYRTLSGPAQHGTAIRSQPPADKVATVPPTSPVVRAVTAAAAAPAPGSATALAVLSHALPTGQHRPAAAPVAGPLAGVSVLDSDPVGPIPASPPGSTTSPYLIGGTGGGTSTKSAQDLAVNNTWATTSVAALHHLLYPGASDLPRSPAAQPSTSPD